MDAEIAVPPPKALLLMRCRYEPVKKWLELEGENRVETEEGKNRKCEYTKDQETVRNKKDLRSLMEEERNVVNTVVMSYDTNYYKLSCQISPRKLGL